MQICWLLPSIDKQYSRLNSKPETVSKYIIAAKISTKKNRTFWVSVIPVADQTDARVLLYLSWHIENIQDAAARRGLVYRGHLINCLDYRGVRDALSTEWSIRAAATWPGWVVVPAAGTSGRRALQDWLSGRSGQSGRRPPLPSEMHDAQRIARLMPQQPGGDRGGRAGWSGSFETKETALESLESAKARTKPRNWRNRTRITMRQRHHRAQPSSPPVSPVWWLEYASGSSLGKDSTPSF